MTSSFYYTAILRYRPSYLLGEVLNIGVLFWFLDEGKFIFKYPGNLERLSNAFGKVPLQDIRAYLKSLENTTKKLSKERHLYNSYFNPQILGEYFLVEDANSLVFGEWKKGVTLGKAPELIAEQEYKEYLVHYFKENTYIPRDEPYLKKKFQSELLKHPVEKRNIKEEYLIKSKFFEHKFPFAWKNDTLNIIAPISFDLKEQQSIHDKAARWFGILGVLQESAIKQNLKFDVLLANPQAEHLQKAYQDAKAILWDTRRLSVNIELKEESEIHDYAAYIAENALPQP